MSGQPAGPAARLHLLYEVTALRAGTATARLEAALGVVSRSLSLDVGVVMQVEDAMATIAQVYSPDGKLRQGQVTPLEHTYCDLALRAGGVLSISQMGASPYAQHPFYQRSGYESYIGAAVTVQSKLYGTLGFCGIAPRTPPFTAEDEELVEMLARWVGVALEVRIAEAARRESGALFRSAFHDTAVAMAVVTPDGRFLEVNRSFRELLGYSGEELLALNLRRLNHPDDLNAEVQGFEQVLSGKLESFQIEKRYLHREGHVVWGHTSVSGVRDDAGVKYFLVQVQNITKRKRYEEQMQVMAYRDELTSLHNRRFFFEHAPERLAVSRQRGEPVALIYLDLNGFKAINDTLGHQAGDNLLRQLTGCFRTVLREEDLLVRFGGDEFVALLCGATEAEARGVAERLAACVKQPLHLSNPSPKAGVSVGVVVAPASSDDLEELLRQADKAMYRAKGRKALDPYAVEVERVGT